MQKITWKEYLFNSWHTTINNRTFYIHKAYDDNDEFLCLTNLQIEIITDLSVFSNLSKKQNIICLNILRLKFCTHKENEMRLKKLLPFL